jgi:hypothetical protein
METYYGKSWNYSIGDHNIIALAESWHGRLLHNMMNHRIMILEFTVITCGSIDSQNGIPDLKIWEFMKISPFPRSGSSYSYPSSLGAHGMTTLPPSKGKGCNVVQIRARNGLYRTTNAFIINMVIMTTSEEDSNSPK